ncbi:MAG: hypothetical protein K9N29_00970 [Candidatus Marinimicrobia bacterium]|nr:hypothetical protein [Candidatus Neomarinimicrobiota bacterium]
MNLVSIILTSAFIASTALAGSPDLENIDPNHFDNMSIEFAQANDEAINGTLIQADNTYYFFHNHENASIQIVNRSEVQYLETNMDINLLSLLKGKDPKSLTDIIELNDGTRIPSIILDIGTDRIQYFTGKSMKRETLPASDIYMLYIDEGTISIPFPVSQPSFAVL